MIQNGYGNRLIVRKLTVVRYGIVNLRQTALLTEFKLEWVLVIAQTATALEKSNTAHCTPGENGPAGVAQNNPPRNVARKLDAHARGR